MAGSETRMLLLGAVAMFEPINGYQIRRELVSWEVDKWAHLNPGSIYNGLATLTRQGHLVRHDLVDAGREVAVYEATTKGRAELFQLMIRALEEVDPYNRLAFHTAFGMLPLLDRKQVLHSLEVRRTALERTLDEFPSPRDAGPEYGPPHAFRGLMLWRDAVATELAWLKSTLRDIGSGALKFEQFEDWGWQPPADDPGWQMNIDREKYRALLGR
ncbi:PadR family transcriptional regulator [Nocardioides sp. AE5]|uniref:PadR family transcriptional regulator n=1 Tax=Nocardioides sp. AE5 TaxID=2962573 RepID=UPI002881E5B0|nr:PadR family transcriptional regulator [Nocardioides sp. AE5]MDT0202365.1 PadR family transcriptional regulator [Nocardioides sp. AE5]